MKQKDDKRPEVAQPKAKSGLVMDIEDMASMAPAKAPVTLKGATRTLPDQDELLLKELHSILEDSPDTEAEPQAPAPKAEPVPERTAEEGSLPPVEEAEPEPEEEPEEEPAPTPEAKSTAAESSSKPAHPVLTYESMVDAIKAAAEAPKPGEKPAVDDDALLDELYALIGDGSRPKPAAPASTPAARTVTQSRPVPPPARITEEDLQQTADEEDLELEADGTGVPGWLKGLFLLLISLFLGGVTFYAVAADLLGKVF